MDRPIVTLVLIIASGCGTYRGGAGYKGPGAFKPPSDYSKSYDSGSDTAAGAEFRGKIDSHSRYIPHGPFSLHWPVERIQINRGFRPADDPKHEGIDLGGKRGLPVYAAHEGVVIYAGHEFNGYGNMVLLEYSGEWATLYAHLDQIAVREGWLLNPGDPIGTMGATGHATGVHLHFEVMHFREPMDPLSLLAQGQKYARRSRR